MPLTLDTGSRRSLNAAARQRRPGDGQLRLKTFSGDVRIDR